MKILGIESSCDETGVAIYDTEKGLLADQLYSQIALHSEYGLRVIIFVKPRH